MKDPIIYLHHIRDSIAWITEFTQLKEELFLEDMKTQQAVLHTLQALGESSKRLPDQMKRRFPDIDWTGIIGLRNVLVHEYLGVDVAMVWDIIKTHLPELDRAVSILIDEGPS